MLLYVSYPRGKEGSYLLIRGIQSHWEVWPSTAGLVEAVFFWQYQYHVENADYHAYITWEAEGISNSNMGFFEYLSNEGPPAAVSPSLWKDVSATVTGIEHKERHHEPRTTLLYIPAPSWGTGFTSKAWDDSMVTENEPIWCGSKAEATIE